MKKNHYAFLVLVLFSALFWNLPSYFESSETLQKISLQTRDIFFRIRQISAPVPARLSDVVIVGIDEESCEKLQARWPWSRKLFARLIDRFREAGVTSTGLNLSFVGLEDGDDTSSRELARAMKEHGRVVIGATFDKENHLVKPNPVIAEAAAGFGYLEKIVDSDFTIRRAYLLRLYAAAEPSFESSFPLQMVAWSSQDPRTKTQFNRDSGLVTAGKPPVGVTVSPDGSYTINYLAAESDFSQVPAWKLIQGKQFLRELKGKVVFVGLTSSIFADTHNTPLGMMSGIGIHANEYLSMVSGRQLRFVPDTLAYTVSWLLSLGVLALFLLRRFWLGILAVGLASFGIFIGVEMLLAQNFLMEPFKLFLGLLLALVTGILTNTLKLLLENKGLETKSIRDKLTGLYTYDYLRRRLEDEWQRCQKLKLPLSVVMADLDRFKKINDTLGHEVGNEMIRRAATVIRDSVRTYDVVSRYGGDEFVILLWHTSGKDAGDYRDRLRKLYYEMAQTLEPALKDSSISVGIATFDPTLNLYDLQNTQALIEKADKDLFLDKRTRRKEGG